jgi:integrase
MYATAHLASGLIASIHAQKNSTGNAYRVLGRADGKQRSLTFGNLPSAERFKTLLEDHGPDEALRVIELDEIGKHVPTVGEWLHTHIDNLTGIQPAIINRYRTHVARDIDPVLGTLPISEVTETTIARWVKQLGGSGNTNSNKHGFVSGAFNVTVRTRVMATNPCVGRRLPHTRVEETHDLRGTAGRSSRETQELAGDTQPRVDGCHGGDRCVLLVEGIHGL